MLFGLIPVTLLEWVCRIIYLLLEGIPPEQRRATAVAWFWMWWPLGKRLIPSEYHEQVESIMKGVSL